MFRRCLLLIVTLLSAASGAAEDWPQHAHDAQRTNATEESVRGPYRFYWRWIDAPFASRVQPVIAGERLFIGSLNGLIYALDAAYDSRGGAPRILWQRDLESPIRTSAAIDGRSVVVGTQQGRVFWLDAQTGNQLGFFSTGGAIVAAPLIAQGRSYLGSGEGTFYAFRNSDFTPVWQRSVGAPVLGSAALSEDGTVVFFMAEDLYAYGLRASDGSLVWRTRLEGQSGSDRWPVVSGSTVIFRTQPLGNFSNLLHTGDAVMDSAGARLADWNSDWNLVRPKIVEHLGANPHEQTAFVLNVASGALRGIVPILYTFGTNDAPSPPTVYNGTFYIPYRPRHGIQTDSGTVHVSTKYDAEMGRLDPATLEISGLTAATPVNGEFRLTSDEPAILSRAGTMLLIDNWERLGAIDLETRELVPIAALDEQGCWGFGGHPTPFFSTCPLDERLRQEGHTRAGAVVAAGRIFWKLDGPWGLGALGPSAGIAAVALSTPPTRYTPLVIPPANPAAEYLGYVRTEPARPVSKPPQDLVTKLRGEVARIVGANGHLLPFYMERGYQPSGSYPPDTSNPPEPAMVQNSRAYWFDPGELVYTLAIAYPYLDVQGQAETLVYLRAEMTRYPPLAALPYGGTWDKQGVAREYYSVPNRAALNTWPPPAVPLQTLYALWAYAKYAGDWQYVEANWSKVAELFAAKKNAINTYAEIAGAIGYARLARQLNRTAEADEGERVAVAAMQAGLDFSSYLQTSYALYPRAKESGSVAFEREGTRGGVFFGLTPEVGKYLRDTNLEAVRAVFRDLTSYPYGASVWWGTRVGVQTECSETSYRTPEPAWALFLAQAYIERASRTQLRSWLDRPWGLGDLWHLQKLVAAIEAPDSADGVAPRAPGNLREVIP